MIIIIIIIIIMIIMIIIMIHVDGIQINLKDKTANIFGLEKKIDV
jgi:hypothetical protein